MPQLDQSCQPVDCLPGLVQSTRQHQLIKNKKYRTTVYINVFDSKYKIIYVVFRYTDMESEDYSFYRSLVFLLENHIQDLGYELTFSTEVRNCYA